MRVLVVRCDNPACSNEVDSIVIPAVKAAPGWMNCALNFGANEHFEVDVCSQPCLMPAIEARFLKLRKDVT